jgi:hypothetical protein
VDEIIRTLGKPMKMIDAKSTADIEQLEKVSEVGLDPWRSRSRS